MKLLVDGKLLTEVENSFQVIQNALEEIVGSLKERNRIPVKVIQDGKEFFSLMAWLNQEGGIDGAGEVNIITSDIKEFQLNAVADCFWYMPNLITGLEKICSDFQAGDEGVAIEQFLDFIDGIKWVSDLIRLCEPLFSEKGFKIEQDSLNKFLTELVQAWENNDYVLVSDLLEYEIKPIFKEWQLRMGDFLDGTAK